MIYIYAAFGFIAGCGFMLLLSFVCCPKAATMLVDTSDDNKDYFRFVWNIEPRQVTCCRLIFVKIKHAELAPKKKEDTDD